VSDAILWDRVLIEAGARVRRSVLADNVHIDSNQTIADAVVVPRALIEGKTPPAKALKGEVQGDNFVVPLAE
jgi:ADP-glucose pyrophosphorylase